MMPQRNKRNRGSIVYWSARLCERKAKQKYVAISRLTKKIIGSCKLIIDGLQCTRYATSHKVHHGSHTKVKSGIDPRKKNFSWYEIPERYLPGRCDFTIIIYNSDIANQSQTSKCTEDYRFIKLQEKINHLMYKDRIKQFAKN